MTVISLDKIVKNLLLRRRYSLHWYLEFLIYAKDGLATLCKDDNILNARYKCLPLNSNHAIEIPNDYLDYTELSVRIDQYKRILVEDDALNLVPNFDANFDIQPYSMGVADPPNQTQYYYYGYSSPYWWTTNYNDWGENLGRQFGGTGFFGDTFKVNKARNEIKINENLCVNEVVLEYISNGMDADSATHIDWYAKDCLESYCMWQFKENNRTYSAGEAEVARQLFINQRQIMRAELSDLTMDKLKRIVQSNNRAIKY